MPRHAIIAGVSGIIGRHLAEHLLATKGWSVTGISRHKHDLPRGVKHIAVDLTNEEAVKAALKKVKPTDVFITTWLRQPTEAENCQVNAGMVRNLLSAMEGKKLKHVALVTGLKHYMGPFEAYAKTKMVTPFREEQPRLPYQNFYYDQEDELYAAAEKQGFSWSVHRPHTLIGYTVGNQMNMAATLGAYAAICKETGRPFVFPGSPQQYEAAVDITDGRIIAKHLLWAATKPAARNEAFNFVNGEVFRWNWMWPKLAAHLGVTAADYPGHAQPLEKQMAGLDYVWDKIVEKHGLKKNALNTIASWWHSDADLGRTIENFTDMTKSREAGFLEYQNSVKSFTDAFDKLRKAKILP
jgi:nucleoside-diphosphate-sugar epimerase